MQLMERSGVPRVTDAKVIAAMTHPLRQRLLAVLRLDGPSTVGVLAQRLGQAPGNISHHLKALAAAGLVEEVPELAREPARTLVAALDTVHQLEHRGLQG